MHQVLAEPEAEFRQLRKAEEQAEPLRLVPEEMVVQAASGE
jgi:hypothetical protein